MFTLRDIHLSFRAARWNGWIEETKNMKRGVTGLANLHVCNLILILEDNSNISGAWTRLAAYPIELCMQNIMPLVSKEVISGQRYL
jgi:hypothetical protein